MDMAKIKQYRDLRAEEKQLDAETKGIKERADQLEREILDDFIDEGVHTVRTDDGSTIYLHRQVWAGREEGVETPDVLAALDAAGLGHFVTKNFNSSTLSAYLRDLDKNDEPLPEALVGIVKPVEVSRIRSRKSSK